MPTNVDRAVVFCQQHLDTLQGPCPENIVEQMIEFTIQGLKLPPFCINLTEDEISSFRRMIAYNNAIQQDDGIVIMNDNLQDSVWFTRFINLEDLPASEAEDTRERIRKERCFFWKRYRMFLSQSPDFFPTILNKLDTDTLNPMMNLLGNPAGEEDAFFKKGLVIGDVQSGKTATYIGLITKAADAGYKMVVLLTGIIEPLRSQTQKRMENGFIGEDGTANEDGRQVGVGTFENYNHSINHPIVVSNTTRENDFRDNIVLELNEHNIFCLVMKKNPRVLPNLIKWLRNNAACQRGMIDFPLLLIDDEADNASVNTRREGCGHTTINGLIRELAQIFTRTTYVGITATPFANVFIRPDDYQDLFPSDFIYVLEAPNNYIGPDQIFITTDENGKKHIPKYHSSLNRIEDAGDTEDDGFSFYHMHDSDWDGDLPDSLSDAICCFFLFNALRDLRGDTSEPSTMMINMSRFTNIHKRILTKVEIIVRNISVAIEYHFDAVNDPDNLQGNVWLQRLKRVWDKQYDTDGRRVRLNGESVTWSMVAQRLKEANSQLQLRAIYTGSERLDYDRYYRNNHRGMRVIAIGGLTLSRGLTLEGLGITYFYRNTCTYDVLMQMGRWFGYRPNYEDLFRIWMSPQSIRWYGEIADAMGELKSDLRRMQEQRLRPQDFGLRVRKISEDLSITAAMKMRSAQIIREYINFTGTLLETPYVSYGNDDNQFNIRLISEQLLSGHRLENWHGKKVIRNVTKQTICNFLDKIRLSPYNTRFPHRKLAGFILKRDDLSSWDICFQEGNGRSYTPENSSGPIRLVVRTVYTSREERKRIAIGQRGKVGGTTDGKVCVDDENLIRHAEKMAEDEFRKKHPEREWKENYPSDAWFRHIRNRNPLLLIYYIEPKEPEEDSNEFLHGVIEEYERTLQPLVCFALGVPSDGEDSVQIVEYAANQVYSHQQLQRLGQEDVDDDIEGWNE